MDTDVLLLDLIRVVLRGEKYNNLSLNDNNARELFNEMASQTILGILSPLLGEKIINDKNTLEKWKMQAFRQVTIYYNILNAQNIIINILEQAGISCVIMKGTAAAINYPSPELRAMGDVDLLVKRKEYKKAYDILLKSGYKMVEDNAVDYHSAFEKDGVLFELHNCVSGVEKGKNYEYLCQLFEDGIDNFKIGNLEEYSFPMLPKFQNGLVLLFHIKHHLLGGLGLRQIIDWMLFVDKHLNDEVWNSEFQPVLKKIGMEHFAIVVTKMCQLKLGLNDKITWCKLGNKKICDDFMNYIFNMGNFGHKANTWKHVEGNSVNGSKSVFKLMQANGCLNWKKCQKYKILKPFAWLWQMCFYIRIIGLKACANRAIRAVKEN